MARTEDVHRWPTHEWQELREPDGQTDHLGADIVVAILDETLPWGVGPFRTRSPLLQYLLFLVIALLYDGLTEELSGLDLHGPLVELTALPRYFFPEGRTGGSDLPA